MASNSSSVIGTASITHTFPNFKSITVNTWSTNTFSAANKKELEFQLAIHPKPHQYDQDVNIYLWHNKAEERLNVEYEVSILNAKNEKCYTKNYQWNYDKKFDHERNVTNFILYEVLVKEVNGFIPNNNLTLFCEVKIIKAGAQILEQSKSNLLLPKMSEDFHSALNTADYSDFVLVVGEKEFKVHKFVLAARSSVLKAMLNADLEEKKNNRVEITDVEVDVFEQLLNYIYSGTVDKLDEYALELFSAADKYQLEELKKICGQSLSLTLTVDTVANILLLADMHTAPELKVNCIKFITANSTKVMATDGWEQMLKTRLDLVTELYKDIANAYSALL